MLCFAVSSTIILGQQQTATLDLTHAVVRLREFEPVAGSSSGGAIGSGQARSSIRLGQPIQIILTHVESVREHGVERVIFEVELENVSDTAIDLPWVASPRDIEPSPPRPYEYQLASLGLVLVTSSGESEILPQVMIYGSETSHSLRKFNPGERIIIRAATEGKIPMNDLSSGSKKPMLRATWSRFRVSVTGNPQRLHETFTPEGFQIQSRNAVPVPSVTATE